MTNLLLDFLLRIDQSPAAALAFRSTVAIALTFAIAVAARHAAGIRRPVLVTLSNRLSVPMTYGFRRQIIILPEAARDWSADALQRALRHELEHVRRDDWAAQLMARFAVAIYWPHPLVWFCASRTFQSSRAERGTWVGGMAPECSVSCRPARPDPSLRSG